MDSPSEEVEEVEILNLNTEKNGIAGTLSLNKNIANSNSKENSVEAEIINLDESDEKSLLSVFSDAKNDLNDSNDSIGNVIKGGEVQESEISKLRVSKGDELSENEEKDICSLLDNQVQCVNLHCQSGVDLAEAPVFVLTYFGVERKKNVLQKACSQCFNAALKHQEKMCALLKNNIPLLSAKFSSQKDDIVVMDSVDEIYEEEVLPESIRNLVENELDGLLENAVKKYNVDYQLETAAGILMEKLDKLETFQNEIESEFDLIEKNLKKTRALIYKDFTPRIKSLAPLTIGLPRDDSFRRKQDCTTVLEFTDTYSIAGSLCETLFTEGQEPVVFDTNSLENNDVVALKEVELPKAKLPPIGKLCYPPLTVGAPIYVVKSSIFGVWIKARTLDAVTKADDGSTTYRVRLESNNRLRAEPNNRGGIKIVTGKQIAYRKPSKVRYPVGTRVIALFHSDDEKGKDAYYAGIIAEPPKFLNSFRYLVFFDDGYAQYVLHDNILLVCECSKFVHEDVHFDSRDFIKSYLDQYPERPMVKLQKGQLVKTEWNGKWWTARVLAVDGSLAKMHFEVDNRIEWIYRGSTRLGPLFAEVMAAAARKEQGALSRHRSMGIASLKKRNMPYVEYSVDQDDAKSLQTLTASKNVAKKSTVFKSSLQSFEKPSGPPKPNEKIEYTTKGYVRTMELEPKVAGKAFFPHQCGPACIDWTNFSASECKGTNPLAIPLIYGFQRQTARSKYKKTIMYRGPCGRRLRNIVEMHRYLRITKSSMGLDLFDFNRCVRVLNEFHLEPNMYCTMVKDISYGHENIPVSCVNEMNHNWPSFMDYAKARIPQDGVNICLDEEFLVCCSCTDDCLDKEKCECWQLTIEGTKLGPGGQIDPNVGYQYKRLLEPVTTGIYECNQRCKCGPTCLNRVAQHPLQLNLQVFRTLRKGWGLRTLNDIPQGGFICIYAGRLHTEQSANDGGRMYGDEYLAELDYIEVVERFKEGYESEVMEPDLENQSEQNDNEDSEDECPDEPDEMDENRMNSDDMDYIPSGLNRLPIIENSVNTRGRNKKIATEEKSESEGEKDKEEEPETEKEPINNEDVEEDDGEEDNENDDDDEMKKKPSKFTAEVPVNETTPPKYKSVREMFGDGADDCYIMDAKLSGNIGRYLNHSCQPNVFVQNVFVDTHDVRFPWVAFFALTYIKAGTELTWDYNYDIGSVPDKVLYCYCNSVDCRGRLL